MNPRPFLAAFAFAALLSAVVAQPAKRTNDPSLAFAYPAGGRTGTVFEVCVGGQRLANASLARLNVPGAVVEIVGFRKLMSQRELDFIENNISVLQRAKEAAGGNAPGWSSDDKRLLDGLRAERDTRRPNRQIPATLEETVVLRVTLPPDAPTGAAELRLATPSGVSNPLVFQIGDLPEFLEPLAERGRADIPGKDSVKTLDVPLPSVINGRLMPADTDRYRFHARRGQRLVFAVSARSLIPYLADAVPGWFQAVLSLQDASGRELRYLDDFRHNPDPAFCYDIPQDGDYVLELADALRRGREDFVYRIAVGELPCVTGIFPAGGDGAQSSAVALHGWNLPANSAALIDAGPAALVPLPLPRGTIAATPLWFRRGSGPELREHEPDDTPAAAQKISVPVTLNGAIASPDDIDRYRLTARKGDELVLEIDARRLGSPLDSVVAVSASDGRVLASNDDHNDPASGLVTHQADSLLRFTAPEDGDYLVTVRDTAGQGGEDYVYRLRVSPPRPGFSVEFSPSSVMVRPGAKADLTVNVVRRDGYTGPVTLALADAPAGLRLSKDPVIPADKDTATISIHAGGAVPDALYDFSLVASAPIDGAEFKVAAVPADDRMQAFLPRHLVPAQSAHVLVARAAGWKQQPKLAQDGPVKIPLTGEARVALPIPPLKGVVRVWPDLRNTPEGVTLTAEPGAPGADLQLVLKCDPARLRAGMQGSFTLALLAEDEAQPITGGRFLGQLQPTTFEIVSE